MTCKGQESTDQPRGGIGERLPLGRAGVPDDVARVALFCVSGLAGFYSGDTILVDGGDIAM